MSALDSLLGALRALVPPVPTVERRDIRLDEAERRAAAESKRRSRGERRQAEVEHGGWR